MFKTAGVVTRKRLLISILTLLLAGGAALVWLVTAPEPVDDPSFICGYPPLEQVREGLTKDAVSKILGPPAKEIDKSKTPYNFFQGEYESKIKVGWVYEVRGWNGSIEVYFGKDGKVIRSNCGVG